MPVTAKHESSIPVHGENHGPNVLKAHGNQNADPVPPRFSVLADDRERESGIAEILQARFNVSVTEARLAWGDYLIGERLVVERKTAQDFALSVIDGRLFRQLQHMHQHVENALVIIEGSPVPPPTIALHPHAFKGAILSVVLAWHVPVLFSTDSTDTALTLWLIAGQFQQFQQEISLRPGRKPKRFRSRQVHIWQGLPYVGPKLAVRLLDRFGSVEQVISAPDDQLMEVDGVGQKLARTIKEVVSAGSGQTGSGP